MESESPFEWPPLESNPEIFTDYMHSVGLPQDWIVSEVFGLDDDSLSFVPKPVIAVIATFESINDEESRQLGDIQHETGFYMKQSSKLDNACGVIACLHSILNNLDKFTLTEDSLLHKYNTEAIGKTPVERATFLENYKEF